MCGCCEMKSSVPHCYFTFLKITSFSTYFILFKIILAAAIAVKKLSFSFLAYILLFWFLSIYIKWAHMLLLNKSLFLYCKKM